MTGFESKRQASKSLAANPWRDAIDSGLVCAHIGTIESFPTAQEALDALIDWHVAVALDPEVSSAAQALIDRGRAAVAEPLSAEQQNIINFLLGTNDLDGVWFGDRHPTERGGFWWRKRLRTAFTPVNGIGIKGTP